jgi:hypothetical protein
MQSHLLAVLAVPLLAGMYCWLRGGAPGSRLEGPLANVDVYAAVIVILSALLCAIGALVIAVSRGDAGIPIVCWLIAISGLLCRSALPRLRA